MCGKHRIFGVDPRSGAAVPIRLGEGVRCNGCGCGQGPRAGAWAALLWQQRAGASAFAGDHGMQSNGHSSPQSLPPHCRCHILEYSTSSLLLETQIARSTASSGLPRPISDQCSEPTLSCHSSTAIASLLMGAASVRSRGRVEPWPQRPHEEMTSITALPAALRYSNSPRYVLEPARARQACRACRLGLKGRACA